MLLFLKREMIERCLQLLFNLLDTLVQEIHKVFLLSGRRLPFFLCLILEIGFFDFNLELLDLFLVLQYHLLTEVGPLGQLLLDLFMVREVFLQVRYHGLHLVVLKHDVLRALALVVQLGCQLHVLKNG